MSENLFVRKIRLKREEIADFDSYPFDIEVIRELDEINFEKPVTFLTGENGTGKSTLIEAIAIGMGLNPEGGSQNFSFSTNDTHSQLSQYLTISKMGRPQTKFFLRAESFYNVATEIENISKNGGGGPLYGAYGGDLHECSHGEAFIKLVMNRFSGNGLYILDEPEAALSPQRQMSLLCLMDELVKKGSQFIIATHSPILLSYRDGIILDLDHGLRETAYKDTQVYLLYKLFLDDPEGMQSRLLDEES